MSIQKKDILTLPNLLSVVRIALIAPIVLTYLKERYVASIIWLVASGITDVVDGFIARRFNMVSNVGKMLDPIADKLTQATVVVIISTQYPIVLPLVFILFFKEMGMLLGAVCLFKLGLRPSEAKWWGKLTTLSIYSVCGIFILANCIGFEMPIILAGILMIIPCAFLVLAMVKYFGLFVAIAKGEYKLDEEKLVVKHSKEQ